jgi:hypothetical protein
MIYDALEFADCSVCPYYQLHKGRTQGDPDSCFPDEAECTHDSDFGSNGPCEAMEANIEGLLCDGELEDDDGYLATGEYMVGAVSNEEIEIAVCAGIDFAAHPYWFIPCSHEEPVPFDTIQEVFHEYFI